VRSLIRGEMTALGEKESQFVNTEGENNPGRRLSGEGLNKLYLFPGKKKGGCVPACLIDQRKGGG